jgi:hypothetical protein
MTKVEDLQAIITTRYLREGRTPNEATAEWRRQSREVLRERESAILAAAEQPARGGPHCPGCDAVLPPGMCHYCPPRRSRAPVAISPSPLLTAHRRDR